MNLSWIFGNVLNPKTLRFLVLKHSRCFCLRLLQKQLSEAVEQSFPQKRAAIQWYDCSQSGPVRLSGTGRAWAGAFYGTKPLSLGVSASKPHSHRGPGGLCSPDPTLPPGVTSFTILPPGTLQSPLKPTFPISLNPSAAGLGGDRRDALEKPWAGSRRHWCW